MQRGFFETLSPEERHSIHEATSALVERLEVWAQRYPRARAKRIPPVALLMAAVTPRLSLPAALLAAQMTFWIFMLDDLADERAITLAEFQQRTEVWYRLARDGAPGEVNADDELGAFLLEIRAELANYPLFEPLQSRWAAQVRLIAEAMAQEYQYGLQYHDPQAARLPAFEEYLHYGTYSIGIPLWAVVVLIVANDASVLDCLEPIDAALHCTGAAIRLYNDYQTLDKELQEGNVNSAMILYQALRRENATALEARLLAEARQRTLQLADDYAQRCRDLVKQVQTSSGQINETLLRIVAFHADFYRERDYHNTSLASVSDVLTAVKPE
ncbi:hypothetical protein TFLX_04453 [Thermoflexales bacterium]|nr:hypothetical protein TFLX_04453 [Thermoflexales bacterium]